MATDTRPAPPELAPHPPDPRARGRRPLAAGHVIVVLVVAALVGSLLNAAGMRKTANGQPVGVRRDVARFFAEPLYDVSHALRIDQLRRGVQAVAGRSGDDDINPKLPGPITTGRQASPPTTTTTAPPKKRAFTPANPMTVWVGGDSLAITPGESFVNIAPSTEVINVVGPAVDGHVATGLARPEVFNWAQHMDEVIAQDQPDAVVLTIGSNDDQTLTGDGGGQPYGTPEWATEYRRRVGGLMDAVTANSNRVMYWAAVPPIRSRADDRYNAMNDVVREEAAKRPGKVFYIDLNAQFRGPDGTYADYIDGVQVRTPDGVHFTRAGGDQVARTIIDAMGKTFDLTSWRQRQPSPTTTLGAVTTTAPGAVPTAGR